MSRGILSQTEKYVVQGMLHEKKSVEEIAKQLGRTEATVQKYIDGELDKLQDTVAKVQVEKAKDVVPAIQIKEKQYKRALDWMTSQMNDANKAKELLDRAIPKLENQPRNYKDLAQFAMKQMSTKDLMETRTTGQRRGGVAIMTETASMKSDEAAKKDSTARSARGALYDIEKGEINE